MPIDRALLLAAFALVLTAPVAVAAPLDPQACTGLRTEHDGLVAGGAKSDMGRGPAWAKANLAPDRLQKIERLIAVEEQLSFRCGYRLTARPAIKEPPKPPEDGKARKEAATPSGDLLGALGLSSIPPPKKKNTDAAKAAKKKRATKE